MLELKSGMASLPEGQQVIAYRMAEQMQQIKAMPAGSIQPLKQFRL
jgi:hypothetical protein